MIFVNGKRFQPANFPDGTFSARFSISEESVFAVDSASDRITWLYDNEAECMLMWYLTKYLRSRRRPSIAYRPMILSMPYVPNARLDRTESSEDIFTLKYFADFINSLEFDQVIILDPHSSVTPAIFHNVIALTPSGDINNRIIRPLSDKNLLLCYPDEGAAKRYSKILSHDYVHCIKQRDWKTGKITGLTLTDPEKVKDRNILIVDDICSRGGTFTYTAQALKAAGAGEIFLYVTHCENTIHEGQIFKDDLISHVYTTNSIYRGEPNERISVLDICSL